MPKKKGPRLEAWKALKHKFPDGMIPDHLPGAGLQKIVNNHLKQLPWDAIEGRVRQEIGLDTVLRAAGRRTG